MANIRHELGRHRWVEGFTEDRMRGEKRPVLKCANCARTYDLRSRGESNIPVTGCISDLDLRKLGPSMQKDQLERDMKGKLFLEHPEH